MRLLITLFATVRCSLVQPQCSHFKLVIWFNWRSHTAQVVQLVSSRNSSSSFQMLITSTSFWVHLEGVKLQTSYFLNVLNFFTFFLLPAFTLNLLFDSSSFSKANMAFILFGKFDLFKNFKKISLRVAIICFNGILIRTTAAFWSPRNTIAHFRCHRCCYLVSILVSKLAKGEWDRQRQKRMNEFFFNLPVSLSSSSVLVVVAVVVSYSTVFFAEAATTATTTQLNTLLSHLHICRKTKTTDSTSAGDFAQLACVGLLATGEKSVFCA